MTRLDTVVDESKGAEVISLEDLRVDTASGMPIVEGVSLSLDEGQILGVVGESGSGKTTTALALFGFAQGGAELARGTIRLPGHAPFELATSKDLRVLRGHYVSYVPQSPGTALNPVMRVSRALREMQEHRNRGDTDARRDLEAERDEVLAVVGLPNTHEFQQRFPHQLSGGQQQRVCLAVALLSGSQTIVLDEPTTGLDVITQASVLDELRRLQRTRRVAMVYISHDLAVVSELATHVAVMYAGNIVEIGTAEQVLTRPAHPYTRGLLSSTPDYRRAGLPAAMPGVAVSLSDRSEDACSFAPRCALATDECRAAAPSLRPLPWAAAAGGAPGNGGRHDASCYHPVGSPFSVTARELPEASPIDVGAVLGVERLTVEHHVRGQRVAAVTDVSFAVARGECLALVGESGSGKTTIARAIAGLQPYETGSITLHGEQMAQPAARRTREQLRRLQIVFQNASLALNPREDVRAAISRSSNLCTKESRRPLEELMELAGLQPGLLGRLPRQLSGGERQRVAIARALATNPEVLICDEITSSLDVSVQAAVLATIEDLQAKLGLALLFITHDIGVVAALADRVMVLQRGSVCEAGPTRSVLDEPKSEYAKRLMDAAPSLSVGN